MTESCDERRLSKAIFIAQAKYPAKKMLYEKVLARVQKKCVKISKIRLKEVIFIVLHLKARISRRL